MRIRIDVGGPWLAVLDGTMSHTRHRPQQTIMSTTKRSDHSMARVQA